MPKPLFCASVNFSLTQQNIPSAYLHAVIRSSCGRSYSQSVSKFRNSGVYYIFLIRIGDYP